MATTSRTTAPNPDTQVPANEVYFIAAISLLMGLVVGYFFLGTHAVPSIARAKVAVNPPASYNGGHPKLTIEQMKQMADIEASTLIDKSKTDPKNATLLVQIAGVYQAAHQFKDAAEYFEKALKIDPKNVSARTELASCLYYTDDVEGALSQLNQALKYNPRDANVLFNLGMIKYRGQRDPAGAIAAWQQLLKTNPNLDRRPIVEQMIAEAKASGETKN